MNPEIKDPRTVSLENAISVVKKLLTGTIVILFVGVCSFICLMILMFLL